MIEPTRGADARRDALTALAAAEAYARGDQDALTACEPATPAETMTQRNILVTVLGDLIRDASLGAGQFVAEARAAIVDGDADLAELTPQQRAALAGLDPEVAAAIAESWAREQRIMRGEEQR